MNQAEKDKRFKMFVAAVTRTYHPSGSYGRGNKWIPSQGELQPCCEYVRAPSHAHPLSMKRHCGTRKHVVEVLRNCYQITKYEDLPLLLSQDNVLGKAARDTLTGFSFN